MTQPSSTVDIKYFRRDEPDAAIPGLVVVLRGTRPEFSSHALIDEEIEVGRMAPGGVTIDDPAMSRRHARVSFVSGRFEVEDLGSRNGLVVDGVPVAPGARVAATRCVRLGETVITLEPDLRPLRGRVTVDGDHVVGPRLLRAWEAVDEIAASSDVLHVRGESGAGKEIAAQRFHRSGRAGDLPFVAVNCAAIPHGVAERLLFGARKGAFSGAHADAEGLVQAAHRGTLFLDEIGELDIEVQAKLLRVIETRTVLAVGDVKPRAIEMRLVSATHQDLREQVAARTFREDLYFRIGRPEVALPPLRERPEEVPWLIELALRGQDAQSELSAELVEACLLRHWPGNARELLLETRQAARRARGDGRQRVLADDLDAAAGKAHAVEAARAQASPRRIDKSMLPERPVIEATLRETRGRVATAARKLGVHRNQLRRWLADHDLDAGSFADD